MKRFLGFLFLALPVWASTPVVDATDPDLPPCLRELVGVGAFLPGPNCFNASLLAHYPGMPRRYVSKDEFFFYLERDFTLREGQSDLVKTDVLVFEGDVHAAYYLGNGRVFDRRGFESHYPYRAVALADAHTGESVKPGASMEDRMGFRPSPPFRSMAIYRRNATSPPRRAPEVPEEWKRDLALLELLYPWATQHTLGVASAKVLYHVVEKTMTAHAARLERHAKADSPTQPWQALAARLGDARVERLLAFLSACESYDDYLRQVVFASPTMSSQRFWREYRLSLRPNLADAALRGLVAGILGVKGEVADDAAIDRALDPAVRSFDATRLPEDLVGAR